MIQLSQLFAPLALAFGGFAVAAQAAPPPSVTLQVEDIELSDPAGVATLDARIANAVRRVCGPQVAGNSVVGAGVRQCRAATAAALESRKLALIAAQRRASALAAR